MEGKYTQQYTSTSGWSRRHGTNSEGYPGGLREVHSVYCCCSGVQWRGRQSKVRYYNCQDRGRRYVLHTACIADLTQFTSTVQTFAVRWSLVWFSLTFQINFSFFIIVVKYFCRFSTIWRQSLKSQKNFKILEIRQEPFNSLLAQYHNTPLLPPKKFALALF